MRRASQTHHVCIRLCGFNIAILIGVLTYVFRRPTAALQLRAANASATGSSTRALAHLGGHFVTVLIIAILVLYTLLVGASASVVRACIMGALVVIALDAERVSWAFNALAIAALVMMLFNPYVVWDIGFQLSFLATLGLLLYAPRLQDRMEGWLEKRTDRGRARQMVEFFKDAFIVTLAAFVVTTPLIILYFHRVSLIGFLTNFLILPVQPPIMVLGGAATLLQMLANALREIPVVGLVIGALAQAVAWAAFIFLQYTILVVQATAAVPFGSFEVARIDAPLVILFYALLFGVTALGVRRAASLLVSRVWIPIALFAFVTVFIWTATQAANDPRTRVTFLAASAGDATFVRTANDRRILINGTNEPGTLLSFLGSELLPWDRRLDVVIATHLDDDNLASLNAVLERYSVGQVLEPPAPSRPGVSYEKWRALTSENKISDTAAVQGTALRVGDAMLDVIYPDIGTDTSVAAVRLQTNGKTFLFAPALREMDRKTMLEHGVLFDTDVAVLPNEVETEFIERTAPETVILFVGRRRQDKPSAETLKLLEGVMVLRTDERGTITYNLDVEQVRVQSEK